MAREFLVNMHEKRIQMKKNGHGTSSLRCILLQNMVHDNKIEKERNIYKVCLAREVAIQMKIFALLLVDVRYVTAFWNTLQNEMKASEWKY